MDRKYSRSSGRTTGCRASLLGVISKNVTHLYRSSLLSFHPSTKRERERENYCDVDDDDQTSEKRSVDHRRLRLLVFGIFFPFIIFRDDIFSTVTIFVLERTNDAQK